MTLWRGGSVFGHGMKFLNHDICQYDNGKIWIVGGLAEDGRLYYFTRKIKDGQIVESPPKLMREETFPLKGTSSIFINERNGHFEFSISTDDGVKCFWIKPNELFPPPPISKLPRELTYNRTKQQVTGCLLPEALFIKTGSDEDWENFLNWVAENEFFNAIRVFSWGGWEAVSWPNLHKPFIQLGNGKFDLNQYNPEYFETFGRRLAAAAERRITIILTMVDNCSLHKNTGAWSRSYWNGDNNINGTSNWSNMLYHYYEKEHQTKPGWRETMEAIEDWVRLMMRDYVTKHFPYVIAEQGNEIWAAQGYHKIYSNIFNGFPPGDYEKFPKKFKQSSVGNQKWIRDKKLETLFMMSLHGAENVNEYHEIIQNIAKPGIKYIISQDGCYPTETPKETEDMTFEVLNDGHLGVEFNFRPLHEWKGGKWIRNIRTPDWTYKKMMRAKETEFFEAVRTGWFRALN